MKTLWTYMLSYAMIVAAVLGLVISAAGFIGALAIRKPLVESLTSTLDLLDDALTATADGLTVAKQSLDKATSEVSTLETTLQSSGKAIQDTTPIFDTLTTMVQKDLPTTIAATQTSLASAQASAVLIENALKLLTSLPLMPVEPYNPEVPLGEALGQVSDSLDPLVESFASLEEGLRTSRGNLVMMQAEVAIMSRHIGQLREPLDNAQSVIDQYQAVVSRLQERVTSSRESLPQWVNLAMISIAIVFLWLAITQIGLLTQGLERIHPSPKEKTEKA